MSWLLPSALAIAGIAAVAAIALHFIARSRPLAEPLPTARFIPSRPIRARTRSIALSDVPLLFVRLAALAALGAAVAGPLVAASSSRVTRVVVVDRSRSVVNVAEARDSARAVLREGDLLLALDSAAVVVRAADSLREVDATGSLSAGFAAAMGAAASLGSRADSVELILVSPLAREELDSATLRLRAAWPGRIRLVATRAAQPDTTTDGVESTASSNDAIVAGLSLMGVMRPTGRVRLVRRRPTAADSAWAAGAGHVLLHWPMTDTSAAWPNRNQIDAIGGVASSSGALVGRFPRLWVMEGDAVARWADGEAAAVEWPAGRGCIRDVGILIDPASDLALRAPFRRFAAALLAPCGGIRATERVDAATLAALAGSGPLAPAGVFRDREGQASRWTPWLLLAAAALLLIELAARRPERSRDMSVVA